MSEDLKNQLNSFVKYIIGKVDQKDLDEIQKKYDELIEYFDNFSILTNEDFLSFEKIMNDYENKQKEVESYRAQKEIDSDKINLMKEEIKNNMEIKEKFTKLNQDYNELNQKFNVYKDENSEFQVKLKNNEKLISDLQIEISNVKKENFEKFEKINELEKNLKNNEIKLNQANEKVNKYTIENNELTKSNAELKNN